jgi:UDP-GlcNAc:undecaprenyl-phosphate GlcNAc-1-phosphate transferase
VSPELTVVVGAVAGGGAALVATPLAVRAARRLDVYDHPHGYHRHAAPTPLLGGAAVIGAVVVSALLIGVSGKLLVLVACAAALCALGTIDDIVTVAPKWRLLAETAIALVLFAVGLDWDVYGGVGDVLLTVLWVVGLVNGFNLMDNLDGACGSVACVSAAGIGTLAVVHDAYTVAGLAFGLAAACLVFLRWNLARPARIFLGDGGSRPIGLLIAGLAMAAAHGLRVGGDALLVGALMTGVVILDTALVTVSRTRRGVTLVTGGRDHLSHRLLGVLGSPRMVAAALVAVQAMLCAVAVGADRWGSRGVLLIVALCAVLLGILAIAILDSARWRPAGIATAEPAPAPQPAEAQSAVEWR